ncbi:AraC family transcriptional regulator [Scatolibacter rhodanostii]|uniref:AraC family transcriptional regulator n=1 Tax=Scatolibacter rhodanostii TaxID=2014781 RepID=UPI000C087D53|nr:AraC family transcriptional regulator [Scatolibacter rhodanostii]
MYIQKNSSELTKEEISAGIRIWNSAAISLLDIRHNLISSREALSQYRLPASAFFFTSGGEAELLLNDTSFHIERFGIFHAGKGTLLSIHPKCEWLEYYMVLYKASEPPFHKREYAHLIESNNPFQTQYGFSPNNPIFISELLRKMYESWKGPTPLNLFFGKSAFYQLVYAVYEELERGPVRMFEPDNIAMAMRYLTEHYNQEISMQELCEMMGMSYSHFYKNFKEQTGVSPQEYLIQVRLSTAKRWLQNSEMPMRAIADSAGFANERNFYRSFAKHYGVSPNTFRKNVSRPENDEAIGNIIPFLYNEESQVSFDELKEKGVIQMVKQMKNRAVMAAALSLVMLLSACGAPSESSDTESKVSSTSSVSSQIAESQNEQSAKEDTRMISTVKGDVEIPTNPKRIVTDAGILGNVLALGVVPIAIEDYTSTDVAYKDLIQDSAVLEKWEPEAIMAQEPDLIITVYEDSYDQLSKVAPTVYIPSDDISVEEKLTFIADVLGKDPAEGKQVVDSFYEKAAESKAKLKDAGFYDKTFSVIRVQGENKIGVRWSNNLGGQILFGALDLPKSEGALREIEAGEDWGATLSFEALPEYMGDYILVTASSEFGYDLIKDNPVWQSLPAVQAGNIIVLSEPYMYLNDIYSWSAQLDLVTNSLLALNNP